MPAFVDNISTLFAAFSYAIIGIELPRNGGKPVGPYPVYYYRDFLDHDFPFKLELRHTLNPVFHAHEHAQICYMTKGACLHHVDEHVYLMTKGDLLAVPPFVPHHLEPYEDQAAELVQIDFMPFVVPHEEIPLDTQLFPKIHVSSDSQSQIEQLIRNMTKEHENKQTGYQMLIKADLIRLIVTLFREHSSPSAPGSDSRRLFYEAVHYIDQHYTDNLQLAELAGRAGMSPSYFSYIFKVLKGQSFVQYVNDIRIRKALDLLRMTDLTVLDIAMRVGFNHLSHFNRMFKKATGVNPLKYRRQAGEPSKETRDSP